MENIRVPKEVVDALLTIRKSGKCNMFDANRVIEVIYKRKMHIPFIWLTTATPAGKVKPIVNRYIAAINELDRLLETELHNSV